jgi:peptidoglycan/xylan/chitin deacetylase (PgdA/CDA1 family)
MKLAQRLVEMATRNFMGTINRVATQEPIIALTFDDGPHPEYTPRLLDILERYQAHATFFMVGEAAQRQPDLVRRVAEAGHAIGNHTYDHRSFPLLSGPERRAQLRKCQQALAPFGQQLFRPPFGDQTIASRLDLLWLGYQVIGWNLHVHDWLDQTAEAMVEQLISRLRPGAIVLLHDALYQPTVQQAGDRQAMLQAVEIVLERLHNQFRFVSVPELLQYGRPHLSNWYKTPNIDWQRLNEQQAGTAQEQRGKIEVTGEEV